MSTYLGRKTKILRYLLYSANQGGEVSASENGTRRVDEWMDGWMNGVCVGIHGR